MSIIETAMTEAELQSAVLSVCRWMGLLAYHTHDSRRSQPGFPDLLIAGPGGHMFRELKTEKGRVSEEQRTWLALLSAGKANAAVWRPSDLAQGRVQAELERIR